MTTRNIRLMGKVWGDPAAPASVAVNFNGVEVFNGPVTTTAGVLEQPYPGSLDVLCEWTGDTAVTGNLPVSITVNNGSLLFVNILMTHYRGVHEFTVKPGTVWPAYAPSGMNEVSTDEKTLTAAEFTAKYGMTAQDAKNNFDATLLTPPDQAYVDVNTNTKTNDGKTNVRIDGVAQVRDTEKFPLYGEWHWAINSGSTLAFDFEVLPT